MDTARSASAAPGDPPSWADPKGLVRESYRIPEITAAECRSILIDWALSLAPGVAGAEALQALIGHYTPVAPDHPMTALLRAGLAPAGPARRRGGRRGRIPSGA